MITASTAAYLAAAGVMGANLGSALLVIWIMDRKAARYVLARKRYLRERVVSEIVIRKLERESNRLAAVHALREVVEMGAERP